MNYKHYILTRFNLGVYDKESPNAAIIKDPQQWMNRRIKLFETHCLPSILNQTNKNFTWIIGFDPETPYNVLRKYDCCERVDVCFEQPHFYLRKKEPEAEWLITSRFDNDDIYLPDFVEMIQSAFREEEEVIDVEYHALDLCTKIQYHSGRPKANSPFLSLCEVWDRKITTALGHPHSDMLNYYPGRKLGLHALQLIHGGNVCNKIVGRPVE